MTGTVASVMYALARDAGLADADIAIPSAGNLPSAHSAECGDWIFDGTTTFKQVMDRIIESIGGFHAIGLDDGIFRIGQIGIWTTGILAGKLRGPQTATIYEHEVLGIRIRPARDLGRPSWRMALTHSLNNTVAHTDIDATVTDAHRAEIGNEWRRVSVSDEDILERCLLATDTEFDSRLVNGSDAQEEAERRFWLYKIKRYVRDIDLDISWLERERPNLGNLVELNYSRMVPDGRQDYALIGLVPHLATDKVTVSLWG